MPIIDTDTHIDETEDTWDSMLPLEQRLKPTTGHPSHPDPGLAPTRYWIIDGERHPRFTRDDVQSHNTVESRELSIISNRG